MLEKPFSATDGNSQREKEREWILFSVLVPQQEQELTPLTSASWTTVALPINKKISRLSWDQKNPKTNK